MEITSTKFERNSSVSLALTNNSYIFMLNNSIRFDRKYFELLFEMNSFRNPLSGYAHRRRCL